MCSIYTDSIHTCACIIQAIYICEVVTRVLTQNCGTQDERCQGKGFHLILRHKFLSCPTVEGREKLF